MFFMRLHSRGYTINELLWGLWLFPFGLLVIKSRFIPWILGALLIVNCFGWVAQSLAGLLYPTYAGVVESWAFPASFGEVFIMLWLVIKGVKTQTVATAA